MVNWSVGFVFRQLVNSSTQRSDQLQSDTAGRPTLSCLSSNISYQLTLEDQLSENSYQTTVTCPHVTMLPYETS